VKTKLFVGISISKRLKIKIDNWVGSKLSSLKVRIIPSKNLHITLIPPWYEKNLNEAVQKMNKIKGKIDSFELKFEKITYGPKESMPRLIWLEGKGNESLTELQKKLECILKKITKRKLLPHVTIARFRYKDFLSFPLQKLEKKIKWKQKVGSIYLYESTALSSGSVYKVLKRINLN